MFYLNEIFFRSIYISIFFIFSFLYFLNSNETFFNLLLSGIIKNKNLYLNNFETSFIIYSPYQIFDGYYKISLLFLILIISPYVCWNIFSFFNSAFSKSEVAIIKYLILKYALFFYFCNYFFILYVFPYCWYIFEILNLTLLNSTFINIEYEPNFLLYVLTLEFMVKTINFILLCFISVSQTIQFLSLKFFFEYKESFKRFQLFLLIFFSFLFTNVSVIFLLIFIIIILKYFQFWVYKYLLLKHVFFYYEIKKIN